MTKPVKENKIGKTKCVYHKCSSKAHGDQICEAIRICGSTEDQSISYITHLCRSFCSDLDSNGRTALHTAALVGKNKVVLYLIAHGANINYQDEVLHCTPLHFAVMSINLGTALILLKYGADAKITDKNGFTPADYMTKPCKILPENKLPVLQGYSWGTNANYNLGLVTGQAKEFPEHFEVPLKRGRFLSSVSMNKFHSIFLTTHGKVFACGHGRGGRLGFEMGPSVITPQYVDVSKYPIVCVSAGVDHTVFLDQHNKVLTCGINDYHQLGIHPAPTGLTAPQVLNEWHTKFPDVEVSGIVAAPFHTVIWSTSEIFCCGLDAGQLGLMRSHIQNEAFVDVPHRSDFLRKLDKSRLGDITKVAASDGATVFCTQMGTVFACYDYEMHRIFSKVEQIQKLACLGGVVNSPSGRALPSHHKNVELKVAFLVSGGDLFICSKKSTQRLSTEHRIWHLPNVSDYCLNACNVCLVNTHQEVLFGHLDLEPELVEPERGNSAVFNYFYNKGVNYLRRIRRGKKMPSLYRTHSIYCDPLGNNYIALQYDPRLFQKRRVGVTPNSLQQDITNHFFKLSEDSGDCDVVVVVEHRRFPAHSYILAYHSYYLCERLRDCGTEREGVDNHLVNEEKKTIVLKDVHPDVFEELLHFMYTNDCATLNDSRRFTPLSNEKGVEQWKTDSFVVLQRVSRGDGIAEALVKLGSSKEDSSKQRWNKKFKYPLKVIKDASCFLKMRRLQDRLLFLNAMDRDHQVEGHDIVSLFAYDRDQVYYRDCLPEFWDVAFRCEDGEVVRAHKCILMARSSYFEAMLGIRWNQSNETDEVDVCLPSSLLRPLLDFLYTNASDDISHSKDLDFICHVLVMAHQYMIEDLHHLCQKALFKCLTLKNAIELLKFCQAFDADRLKIVIIEFICLNMPHFFDSRQLKDLDEETMEAIGRAYRRTIGPHFHTQFWSPEDEERCYSGEDESEYQSHTEEFDAFDGFSYSLSQTSDLSPSPTCTQASNLPTLEDLQLSLKNHPSVRDETPEDWFQNRKEFEESPAAHSEERRKSESGFGAERKKFQKKKKSRKNSSSSLVSSSSNSESEKIFEVEGDVDPFSFEDLHDRFSPSPLPDEERHWKVVGKIKNEKNLTKDTDNQVPEVQNLLGQLEIKNDEKDTPYSFHGKRSDGSPAANVRVMSHSLFSACVGDNVGARAESPSWDKSPFPTLSEALSMSSAYKGSIQIKRMPKMQLKSGKKSKKTENASEEQPKSPASSPPSAWGWGAHENYPFLAKVMRSESASLPRSVPRSVQSKAEKCSENRIWSSSLESRPDYFAETSPSPRKLGGSFENERYHWNPVTNSVIESPKEAVGSSFSSIMQEEVSYIKNLEHERNKPLSLIQLEEKAIKELLEFYGGEYNPEERVTVARYGGGLGKPSWNVQYRNV